MIGLWALDQVSIRRFDPFTGANENIATLSNTGAYVDHAAYDPVRHIYYLYTLDLNDVTKDAFYWVDTLNGTFKSRTVTEFNVMGIEGGPSGSMEVDTETGELFYLWVIWVNDSTPPKITLRRLEPLSGKVEIVATIESSEFTGPPNGAIYSSQATYNSNEHEFIMFYMGNFYRINTQTPEVIVKDVSDHPLSMVYDDLNRELIGDYRGARNDPKGGSIRCIDLGTGIGQIKGTFPLGDSIGFFTSNSAYDPFKKIFFFYVYDRLHWMNTQTGETKPIDPPDQLPDFFDFIGSSDERIMFHRGDADTNGTLELTDAILILDVLFQGSGVIACQDSADSDDNGRLQLTDAVLLLSFLFQGTGTIPAPGGTNDPCGIDPTEDLLDCAQYQHCR